MKKIAFFTEAGTSKGMGHLIRCYTIAQEFKRQKIKVDFFIDSDINFDDKFNDIQYFKWEDLKINSNYHIIFIDSYEANIEIYNYISLSCNTAVYIDDYKRLNYPKGTILNFAPDSKEIFYNKKDSKYNYLLGLNYIPIRDEFLNLNIEKKEQIFIMLGGFDVANLSLKIVDSLDNLSIPITIVINNKDMIESFNKYKNIEILHKPSDTKLIEAMACSSLAISTASMSVYELAFLRIPTLVIAVAKNQELGISQLIKYNIVSDYVSIKNKNWKNEIKEKVQYIFNHKDNIIENNIDGNGTKNIVTEILELQEMDKSKKILILGGSHRDIPLIKASQELGYFVITLGNGKGYLGHSYSDKFYNINFNELSKVKEIIRDEQIDYLIPGCGEESYLNTVQLNQKLKLGNLDNLKTAKLVHNKWKFKEFCLENSISTPSGFYYTNDSRLDNLEFPVVVKPTNLSGGRGVDVVYNLEDLKDSLLKTKEFSNEIFLEEFIDGELIAYSIFIKNQKIIYGFTGKDDTYMNKYLITSAYPIQLEEVVFKRLQSDIEKISELLCLVDGMFHLQVIIKDNMPYIIDVTRRIPGDFYPNLMEYCDKIKYSKAVVNAYIGEKLKDELIVTKKQEFVIRHCVMSDKNGIFKEIQIDDTLKNNIIFRFDLVKKNTEIKDFLTTQISIVFIKLLYQDRYVLNHINELIHPIVSHKI